MFRRTPRQMDELLREFLKRLPQKEQMQRGMVLHLWPSVVGSRINNATDSRKFSGDTLIVTVRSEAWRYELHANRYSIAKKMNRRVKVDVINKINIHKLQNNKYLDKMEYL